MNDRQADKLPADGVALDDRLLDQLVDGTLDRGTQKNLLTQLDRTPDGWRRCAVAFLEAQAWRDEFQRIPSQKEGCERPAAVAPATLPTSGRPSASRRAMLHWLGTALAVCLAFGLGWRSRPVTPIPPGGSAQSPAAEAAANLVQENGTGSGNQGEARPMQPEAASNENVHVAARLVWQLEQDGKERKVELPVLEGPGIDLQWAMQQPSAIQEPIRRALERRGHKVDTRRQLLTVDLKDGRSVVVPVDQVQVKFAKRMFQ